jgi:hypothetical protein
VAGVYWSRKSEASLERGWDRFFHARTQPTTEELREVADNQPNTAPALWSRVGLADRELAKGVDMLFEDRAAAAEALKDAADAYEFTIEHAPSGSLLAERATFGLGEAYESQNELEKAREQYAAVESKWPGGAFSVQAQRRLADLDKASTKAFYDWFAQQETKRKPPSKTSFPGAGPDFDINKLDEHSFQPPIDLGSKTFGDEKKGDKKKTAAAGPSTEEVEDKEGGDGGATEKPEAEKPETEKKAADEKPASAAEGDDSAEKTPEEK